MQELITLPYCFPNTKHNSLIHPVLVKANLQIDTEPWFSADEYMAELGFRCLGSKKGVRSMKCGMNRESSIDIYNTTMCKIANGKLSYRTGSLAKCSVIA